MMDADLKQHAIETGRELLRMASQRQISDIDALLLIAIQLMIDSLINVIDAQAAEIEALNWRLMQWPAA